MKFNISNTDSESNARVGCIEASHGLIQTPVFMPVGTQGAVKAVHHRELRDEVNAEIILANTYHLYLRPGADLIEKSGGIHKFMSWDRNILTDSGGYQVYSLASNRKITDEGVRFKSHIDGSTHLFTPESVIDIQRSIGSDIMMMLDVCPSGSVSKQKWIDALNLTTKWAQQAKKYYDETEPLYGYNQIISPIVQGGTDLKLREQSAMELMELDCDMHAIGGLAVGEPKNKMLEVINFMDTILPKEKPRYLMGVGTPSDILGAVKYGIDMFDCVMPTRSGRTGLAFTWDGKLNLKNSKFQSDKSPLDPDSNIRSLNLYSKSYLNHLIKTNELLASMIISLHNVNFYQQFMSKIRKEIKSGTFNTFYKKYINFF